VAITERRSRKRYPLRLPITVRPPGASAAGEILTESKDVNSHGVYFLVPQSLESGSRLEIMLTLPSEITHGEPVRIRCETRIQRTESKGEGQVGVAAKIERYRFLPGKREQRRAS
jgi:hypothetical protein